MSYCILLSWTVDQIILSLGRGRHYLWPVLIHGHIKICEKQIELYRMQPSPLPRVSEFRCGTISQTGKNTAASAKESAANMAASAKAGMEKTKASLQEKGEKLTAHDPMQKEMAREKKDERKHEAEYEKQAAREHNAAQRQAAGSTGNHTQYSTTGGIGGTDHHTGTGGTY
ncbi:hypothetical protein L2E82_20805 [Cichorium intybus]|uniref:Uncharacterized protein n=1 Tax=Cichorium intybus TaxID=13427 RepID=A0ACB9DV72_CICIN|nr:hypothetical protein L2E82_20805 [Cichorium intybus]